MSILLNFVLVLVPSGFLMVRAAYSDRRAGRSSRHAVSAAAAGYVSVVPIILLLSLLAPHGSVGEEPRRMVLYSFLGAGLLEEGTKLAAFALVLRGTREPLRIQDGVRYAALVGLGFAFVENLFYISEPILVVVLRSVTALPLHVSCAALTGYFLTGSRLEGRRGLGIGLGSATLLHGLYDLSLQQSSLLIFLAIVPLFTAIIGARHFYLTAQKLDHAAGRSLL